MYYDTSYEWWFIGKDMVTLTLRLPDNLDRQLTALAAQTHQNRSELVRTALEKFLLDLERKQLMNALVSEAKATYLDEAVRREARDIAEEFLPLENEAMDIAEGRKPVIHGQKNLVRSGGSDATWRDMGSEPEPRSWAGDR